MTSPLPSPLGGYLCPEATCPALLWLSTDLQPLLSPAQPLKHQEMPATNSATSGFCRDARTLLTGVASSAGAAPEQDPRHSLSISFLSVAVLGTSDTVRDKTDVVLALLALVLVTRKPHNR